MKSKAGTTQRAEQRLIAQNGRLLIPEIDALADEFAHDSIELNDLLQGLLR